MLNLKNDIVQPSNYYNCETEEMSDNTETKMKRIIIVYNYIYNNTFVLEKPEEDDIVIITAHTDYGFISLLDLTTSNELIINFIKETFDNYMFDNIEELNNTLDILSKNISLFIKNINTNKTLLTEEKVITDFLNMTYILNDDINHRIKFTDIYNIIVDSPITKPYIILSNFKNKLSQYLKNMGLQKKRYNDGYYYYGIHGKTSKECEQDMQQFLQELKNKRNEIELSKNVFDEYNKEIIVREKEIEIEKSRKLKKDKVSTSQPTNNYNIINELNCIKST